MSGNVPRDEGSSGYVRSPVQVGTHVQIGEDRAVVTWGEVHVNPPVRGRTKIGLEELRVEVREASFESNLFACMLFLVLDEARTSGYLKTKITYNETGLEAKADLVTGIGSILCTTEVVEKARRVLKSLIAMRGDSIPVRHDGGEASLLASEGNGTVPTYPYVWYWRTKLGERKGQRCRVLARGKLNTIAVEFEDGHRVTTSRYAIRKADRSSNAR
jgi:hypothetical protein